MANPQRCVHLNDRPVGPLRLWLVRHGLTDWNVAGRLQGWSDVPLSELGREQAKLLKPRFLNKKFDAVVSSDLSRAVETAQLAGFEPKQDIRLREIGFGIFEGDTKAENQARPEWVVGPEQTRSFVGGESYGQLQARIQDWLNDLPEAGEVIVFTHGGPIRGIVCSLLAMTSNESAPGWWRVLVDHTSISLLECWRVSGEARWALRRFNDHSHLENI